VSIRLKLLSILPKLMTIGLRRFNNLLNEFPEAKTRSTVLKLYDTAGNQIAFWLGFEDEKPVVKEVDPRNPPYATTEISMHIDSIPSYVPVVVARPDKYSPREYKVIEIMPIEDLWHRTSGSVMVTERGEEVKLVNEQIYTLGGRTRKPWTRIKYIVRHFYKGKLVRIRTMSGVVDVTPNHSVYLEEKNTIRLVKAEDVQPGDRLFVMRHLPIPKNRRFFLGGEDLAWFYGLFVADGCAHLCSNSRGQKIIITNNDDKIISRSLKVIKNYFGRKAWIKHIRNKLAKNVVVNGSGGLYEFFRENFYTVSGLKKVPAMVLNAPTNIVKAFLEGYYDGDGYRPYKTGDMVMYTSKSWALAQAILWMELGIRNRPWRVYTRSDKPNVVEVRICGSSDLAEGDRNVVEEKQTLDYEGYVYDLGTDTNRFVAGVGNIVVHNTFIKILKGKLDFRAAYLYDLIDIKTNDGLPVGAHFLLWAAFFDKLLELLK